MFNSFTFLNNIVLVIYLPYLHDCYSLTGNDRVIAISLPKMLTIGLILASKTWGYILFERLDRCSALSRRGQLTKSRKRRGGGGKKPNT